mmetsp:Transcript_30801/g.46960  ORF Transcript_30801/g.46960 Transcript_30801/m.46960 type:complete len:88 (-) Transcript_30801:295-558(-)
MDLIPVDVPVLAPNPPHVVLGLDRGNVMVTISWTTGRVKSQEGPVVPAVAAEVAVEVPVVAAVLDPSPRALVQERRAKLWFKSLRST